MARYPHMAVLERNQTQKDEDDIMTPSSSSSSSPASQEMVDAATQTTQKPESSSDPSASSQDAMIQALKKDRDGAIGCCAILAFLLFLFSMVALIASTYSESTSSKTRDAENPGDMAGSSSVGQEAAVSVDGTIYKYTIFAAEVATKTITETVFVSVSPSATVTAAPSATGSATTTHDFPGFFPFVFYLVLGALGGTALIVACIAIIIQGFRLIDTYVDPLPQDTLNSRRQGELVARSDESCGGGREDLEAGSEGLSPHHGASESGWEDGGA